MVTTILVIFALLIGLLIGIFAGCFLVGMLIVECPHFRKYLKDVCDEQEAFSVLEEIES